MSFGEMVLFGAILIVEFKISRVLDKFCRALANSIVQSSLKAIEALKAREEVLERAKNIDKAVNAARTIGFKTE